MDFAPSSTLALLLDRARRFLDEEILPVEAIVLHDGWDAASEPIASGL